MIGSSVSGGKALNLGFNAKCVFAGLLPLINGRHASAFPMQLYADFIALHIRSIVRFDLISNGNGHKTNSIIFIHIN